MVIYLVITLGLLALVYWIGKPCPTVHEEKPIFSIPIITTEHTPNQTHRHDGKVFEYPTIGIPIPGREYNSTKVKPEEDP